MYYTFFFPFFRHYRASGCFDIGVFVGGRQIGRSYWKRRRWRKVFKVNFKHGVVFGVVVHFFRWCDIYRLNEIDTINSDVVVVFGARLLLLEFRAVEVSVNRKKWSVRVRSEISCVLSCSEVKAFVNVVQKAVQFRHFTLSLPSCYLLSVGVTDRLMSHIHPYFSVYTKVVFNTDKVIFGPIISNLCLSQWPFSFTNLTT